jgi:hypothetical protein
MHLPNNQETPDGFGYFVLFCQIIAIPKTVARRSLQVQH